MPRRKPAYDGTVSSPEAFDATNPGQRKRRKPVYAGTVPDLPPRTRQGFWPRMMEEVVYPKPYVWHRFLHVSNPTVTDLRKTYGVDATYRDGTAYIWYDPARVTEIRSSYAGNEDLVKIAEEAMGLGLEPAEDDDLSDLFDEEDEEDEEGDEDGPAPD